jgi:catechol 2,3-dioxygenase-like lactoylglutathione lyase family enzyme
MGITRIDASDAFSSFAVPDTNAAKAFYGDLIGMGVEDLDGLLRLSIGGGKQVLVYPKPDHVPATYTVLNFPVDDVEATVDELTGAGVRFEQYDWPGIKTDHKGIMRGNGPDIAWFRDPAGNIVSVVARS